MPYTTVLFDADGTLLDFSRSEDEAVRATMLFAGVQPDDEKVANYSRINDGLWKMLERGEIEKSVLLYRRFELFCEHYGYVGIDARAMAREYMEQLSQRGYLLDGARELLDALHGKVKMYIVTNGVEFIQRRRYAHSGLESYFDGLFISDELGFEKPDPRYFECVESKIENFSAKDTIVVGDSLTSDIKGGVEYGIDTCWLNPKGKEVPEGMDITYVIGDIRELLNVLE